MNKKKALAMAVTLWLITPWNGAGATGSYISPSGLIKLDYYDAGESFKVGQGEDEDTLASEATLPGWQKQRIAFAVNYWDTLLKHTAALTQPAIFAVKGASDDPDEANNSSAVGVPTEVQIDGKEFGVASPNAVLNYDEYLGNEIAGIITIGTQMFPQDARKVSCDTPLPHGSTASLAGTMIHELGHAMGISCIAGSDDDEEDDETAVSVKKLIKFHNVTGGAASDTNAAFFSSDPQLFDSHLYDHRGVQAKPGMEIQTVNHKAESGEFFDLPGYWGEAKNLRLPYFSGKNVQEVLGEGTKIRTYNTIG